MNMEYTIISKYNMNDLIEEVNSFINKGWIPQGGIYQDNYDSYCQAMINNSKSMEYVSGKMDRENNVYGPIKN